MNRMRIFLMIMLLMAGSFTLPTNASACSCIDPPSVEEELSRSDAVFSGKVIAADEKLAFFSVPSKSFVFEVARTWKGIEQSQVKITTGQGGGDCGFDFSMGQEYLVYAVNSNSYGINSLSTMICDRTDILSLAQDDMAILGVGQQPTEEVDLLSRNNWQYAAGIFIVLGIIAFIVYRKRKKIS